MTATHGEGTYGNAVGVTTSIEHKMAQVTEFVKTTTKNIIRPGVLYNGDASLVAGTAGMSYDVDAFSIVTQRSATSGVVKWANDGTLNVATTAAPGSNSRYDVVYAWHREYALDGVDSNPVIGVVQGTAAASPTVPSLSAFPGAVELARILVPSGVTATNSGTTFTQTAPFTAVDGGTVPFRTLTEINAWTTAITGQRASDITTGVIYRWSGSVWRLDTVPSVASAAARDALYTGSTVPVAGDTVYRSDFKAQQIYTGSQWRFNVGRVQLVPAITPSGSLSVTADGTVTLTAASTADIRSWASAEFDDYQIEIKWTARSAVVDTKVQFLVGSTPSTVNYVTQQSYGTNTTVTARNVISTEGTIDAGGQALGLVKLDVANISKAEQTQVLSRFRNSNTSGGTTDVAGVGEIFHAVSTAYDGIRVFPSSGTISGTIKIYGIPN